MERKIGEVFEYEGEWYQCINTGNCSECAFTGKRCYDFSTKVVDIIGDCSGRTFKKLEKVGEPCEFQKRTIQTYKLYIEPFISSDMDFICTYLKGSNTIDIIIKQNKEDMEEKRIQLRQEDIDWLKSKIRWSVLPGYSITYEEDYDRIVEEVMKLFSIDTKHSNSESVGKNLRPFDLQKAREGKPVCTREGRKARIICFDRNDLYPIVALIECEDGKEIIGAYSKEGQTEIYEIKGTNLMMLPEKKEGWVNVYKMKESTFGYITVYFDTEEKAKEDKEQLTGYVATVKINWEE